MGERNDGRSGRGKACRDIGAGQQSRIHCTRLAGGKADNWWLRQSPQVMNLPFVDGIRRADRDNAIDLYMGDDYMDVLADDAWPAIFKEKPEVFTREAKREWLDKLTAKRLVNLIYLLLIQSLSAVRDSYNSKMPCHIFKHLDAQVEDSGR